MTNETTRTTGRNYYAIVAIVFAGISLIEYSIFLGPIAMVLGSVGLARAVAGGGLRRTSLAAIVIGFASASVVLLAHFT